MHFLSLPSLPRSQGPVSRPLFRRSRTFSSSWTLSTFQSASWFLLQRSARRRSSIPPPSLVHPIRCSVVFGALGPREISIRIDISFPIPSRPPPRPFATGFHRGTFPQGIVRGTGGAAGLRVDRGVHGGALGGESWRNIPSVERRLDGGCDRCACHIRPRADTNVAVVVVAGEVQMDRRCTDGLQTRSVDHSQDKLSRVSTPVVGLVPEARAQSCW